MTAKLCSIAKLSTCKEHPTEALRFYCTFHNDVICSLCAIKRHKLCQDTLTFHEAIERFEREHQNLFKALDNQAQAIEKAIEEKQEAFDLLNQNTDMAIDQIKRLCDKLHAIIDEKKSTVVAATNEETYSLRKELSNDLVFLNKMLATMNKVKDRAQNAFQNKPHVKTIKTMIKVQNTYCDIEKSSKIVLDHPTEYIYFEQSNELEEFLVSLQSIGKVSRTGVRTNLNGDINTNSQNEREEVLGAVGGTDITIDEQTFQSIYIENLASILESSSSTDIESEDSDDVFNLSGKHTESFKNTLPRSEDITDNQQLDLIDFADENDRDVHTNGVDDNDEDSYDSLEESKEDMTFKSELVVNITTENGEIIINNLDNIVTNLTVTKLEGNEVDDNEEIWNFNDENVQQENENKSRRDNQQWNGMATVGLHVNEDHNPNEFDQHNDTERDTFTKIGDQATDHVADNQATDKSKQTLPANDGGREQEKEANIASLTNVAFPDNDINVKKVTDGIHVLAGASTQSDNYPKKTSDKVNDGTPLEDTEKQPLDDDTRAKDSNCEQHTYNKSDKQKMIGESSVHESNAETMHDMKDVAGRCDYLLFQTLDHARPCWIYGIEFLREDRIVISDVAHDSVQLFDTEGNFKCEETVSFTPWDVTRIDDNTVGICSGVKGQVTIYNVTDSGFIVLSTIDVGSDCNSLAYDGGRFVIGSRQGCILVKPDGSDVIKFDTHSVADTKLRRSDFITVDNKTGNIFMVNSWSCRITALTNEGHLLWEKSTEGVFPRGIVIKDSKLFVSCKSLNVINVFDPTDGSHIDDVISDQLDFPYGITHHMTKNMLAITKWEEKMTADETRTILVLPYC
ncbi:uncharacterized protein LOC128243669 [Mya arenaria]|nr:uncharacterized protein LOC128243669 [Mya arenaria]